MTLTFDHPVALSLDSLLRGGIEALSRKVARALSRDDYSEALKLANAEYAEAGPADLNAVLTYALLLNHRDLGEESLGILRKALTHHADAPELQLAQVEALLADEEFEAAVELMMALETLTFQDPRHVAYLGDLFLDVGLDENSIRAYEQALHQGSLDAGVATNLGQLYLERAEFHRAAHSFERAAKMAPDEPEIWATAADTWMGLEEWQHAIHAYRRVTTLRPDDAQSWMYLGIAFSGAGELEEALDAFVRASRAEPDEPLHWLNIGHVQLELGLPDKALRSYEKVLDEDDQNAEAAAGMTAAAFELGDVELAQRMGERAIALDPENPDARYNLAMIELALGRLEPARANLLQALDLEPDEPRYTVLLASVELRAGAVDRALDMVAGQLGAMADDATALFEFARDLLRYGGADRVADFLPHTCSDDPRWAMVQPLLTYLVAALRPDHRDEASPDLARSLAPLSEEHPELLPLMWDFDVLEELAMSLPDPHRQRVETMLAVLEARKAPEALAALPG